MAAGRLATVFPDAGAPLTSAVGEEDPEARSPIAPRVYSKTSPRGKHPTELERDPQSASGHSAGRIVAAGAWGTRCRLGAALRKFEGGFAWEYEPVPPIPDELAEALLREIVDRL
jgi:hypothetical protein